MSPGGRVIGDRNVQRVTRLWQETFAATVVITTEGNEARLRRLIDTLPFDPALLRIDRCPAGQDCRTGRQDENHHLVVGNRHKRVIEGAAREGLANVCVLEDDAEFVWGDPEVLASTLEWMRDHADRWDVFYLGFGAPMLTRCSYVTRHVIRTYRPFFAHALCYNRRAFERILAIDFASDHRPLLHRTIEAIAWRKQRESRYFREGVGSLDTWLSFSRLRKYASFPPLVVQTALPPGTEDAWRRRTGQPYDAHVTPRQQVRIALAVHYGAWMLGALGVLAVLMNLGMRAIW